MKKLRVKWSRMLLRMPIWKTGWMIVSLTASAKQGERLVLEERWWVPFWLCWVWGACEVAVSSGYRSLTAWQNRCSQHRNGGWSLGNKWDQRQPAVRREYKQAHRCWAPLASALSGWWVKLPWILQPSQQLNITERHLGAQWVPHRAELLSQAPPGVLSHCIVRCSAMFTALSHRVWGCLFGSRMPHFWQCLCHTPS